MVKEDFSGVFAPLVTVFDENEEILYDKITENVRIYNKTDLKGYMPLGSNGEFQGLTAAEAFRVLETVCREKSPEKIVVGGCGRESVKKTLEFIRSVAEIGLDYAFLLPPHYFAGHTKDEGLYGFFMRVAEDSPIPIVIYNAPKFTGGVSVSPQLTARLAEHENIVAVKNSSTIAIEDYIVALENRDMEVLGGNINNFFNGMSVGATGGVLSTASYLPEYCCNLYHLIRSGNYAEATKLNLMLHEVAVSTAGPCGVAGVKAAMEIRGMNGGCLRLPLRKLPEEEYRKFAEVFEQFGIPAITR